MQLALKQIPADIDKQAVSQLVMLLQKYMDVFPKDLPSGIPEHVVMHEIWIQARCQTNQAASLPISTKISTICQGNHRYVIEQRFHCRSSITITSAHYDSWQGWWQGYRFCMDYRAINAQTVTDATPPPNIQMLFDQLKALLYLAR